MKHIYASPIIPAGSQKTHKDIEIKYRALINVSDVLLLDQCLAEPAVDKRLSNCHKDCQHGDQAELFGKKQPCQDDRDDKLDSLLAETF